MIKAIMNLVRQMESEEQEELMQHIKSQYGRDVRDGMLRDDIKEKVLEISRVVMNANVDYITEKTSVHEIDRDEILEEIEKEFELESVGFSEVMNWKNIADIINSVEYALEEREMGLHE